MNSPTELRERLLKLWPVKIIKGQFDPKGQTQAEMLPEIASTISDEAIKKFAVENVGYTRQHSYIFRLGANFDREKFVPKDLPLQVVSESRTDGNYIFFCLPIVEYDVALMRPPEEFTVHFYQPTRIVVKGKALVIQTTIMERSASAYIAREKDRKMFDLEKRNTEDLFIPKILAEFRKRSTVEVCDLNKGVKAVWEKEGIDATSVKYRDDKAMTTQAMDEEYTFKQNMPERYKEILLKPLSKTAFRPLREEDKFSRNFMVDPSKGLLSMNTYPEHPDQTWNIINEILRNN